MELTQQGAYISTMAQENKQEGLNAVFFTGASAYEAGFNPGSAGNGSLLTTVTALYMGEDAKVIPAVGTFDKWAKKVDPQTQLDLYTLYGWISAELFVQALKGAGANPTRASLDAQLNKVTSYNAGGLIANQDPAQKIPGTPRRASCAVPGASTRAITRASRASPPDSYRRGAGVMGTQPS
jgi:ABC-type branched-subunit amino acid transport system substrate-binding protein